MQYPFLFISSAQLGPSQQMTYRVLYAIAETGADRCIGDFGGERIRGDMIARWR
jgi:hypothetical protein